MEGARRPWYAGGGAWEEWAADDGTPYYHSLWSTKVMWEHPQRAWLRGVATAAREGAALLAHTGYT